jgi:replicative DNA helicase
MAIVKNNNTNTKNYTTANPLKIPPQNLEAEKALLGSVMMRPGAVYEIVDIVSPKSFYFDKHRIIFEVMLELLGKNEPIDLLTISSRLKEKKFFRINWR